MNLDAKGCIFPARRMLRGTSHQWSILNCIEFGKNPLVLFSDEFCGHLELFYVVVYKTDKQIVI